MYRKDNRELQRIVDELRITIRKEHPRDCEIDITPFVLGKKVKIIITR